MHQRRSCPLERLGENDPNIKNQTTYKQKHFLVFDSACQGTLESSVFPTPEV